VKRPPRKRCQLSPAPRVALLREPRVLIVVVFIEQSLTALGR